AAIDEIIDIACDIKPELATIVPERRQELTTESGINVIDNIRQIKYAINRLHEAGISVSLFIEPDINQVDAAAQINADYIEIHTGNYARANCEEELFDELERVRVAAKHAKKLGLGVNAGHGLNYINMKEFVAISEIDEVSIGHAVIARAVFVGLEQAIKEMIKLSKSI
ncbi:MAG: pyridoxine 5'-phosphate synthase, partial [Bacteroidota bacterium]